MLVVIPVALAAGLAFTAYDGLLAPVWRGLAFYGPLDPLLATLGLRAPAWLVDERTALPAIALTALFQIGDGSRSCTRCR